LQDKRYKLSYEIAPFAAHFYVKPTHATTKTQSFVAGINGWFVRADGGESGLGLERANDNIYQCGR
jgi:hypothetical protein